jgi:hypothetical protein
MLDAHPALLKVIDNPVFPGKISYDFGQSRGLDVLGRLEMVGNKDDLIFVKYRAAYSFEFRNGRRRRNIIGHYQIQAAVNQVSRLYGIQPGVFCQDFLCHCHTHRNASHFPNKKSPPSPRDEGLAVPLLFMPLACTHADNGQMPAGSTAKSSILQLRDEFEIRFRHFSPSNDSLGVSGDFYCFPSMLF